MIVFCAWINLCSTLFLTGLIWTIQLVHYPAFHFIKNETSEFVKFEQFHASRITYIVMPAMFLELGSSLYLVFFNTDQTSILNFSLIGVLWLVTFFVSVPCHGHLSRGYDRKVVNRLVHTNWIRTIAWSLKSICSIVLLNEFLG